MGKDGGSCSGNDQNAGRFTPGSRSRHLGEVSCPHSHGLQRCDCFSPWLLRPRRRPRVARHWWPALVVYISDQVRALENEMLENLQLKGLDFIPRIVILTRLIPNAIGTSCNQRIEKVTGSRFSHILRIPFRHDGKVLKNWISRFDVYPYLETYAQEAANEICAYLSGPPDLAIGNSSDGNLVATLLCQRLDVTQFLQCTIAHALEKTKYPDSDIYWKKFEEKYHFSCQFTADLIAMNHADFIITSTYQEIAGSAKTVGQYETTRRSQCQGCTVW